MRTPTANATEAFGGIVSVLAEALLIVTCLPESVKTSVYEVPVCVFTSSDHTLS
jgi:hypothetical protein